MIGTYPPKLKDPNELADQFEKTLVGPSLIEIEIAALRKFRPFSKTDYRKEKPMEQTAEAREAGERFY